MRNEPQQRCRHRPPCRARPVPLSGQEGGFTLIELLVVLVLLGTLLGLVLPRTVLTAGMGSVSRHLIGAMYDAFGAASATRRIHRLNFDLSQGSYWITQVTPDGERPPDDPLLARPVALPAHITLRDVSTRQQGKVASGRAFIQFYPAGRVEPATIHLTDEDQNVTTLRLNPLTGHVQALDRDLDPPGPETIPERLRPWFYLEGVRTPGPASPAGGLR